MGAPPVRIKEEIVEEPVPPVPKKTSPPKRKPDESLRAEIKPLMPEMY